MNRTSTLIEFLRRACATVAVLLACCAVPVNLASQNSASQSSQPEAAADPEKIFQQMSRITGLPIKAPLKKERVSKAEVEKYLKENLAAEYTPAEIHGEEAALKAFGLVDADFDLQKFLISLYTEQAAGFYDPRRKTMFIADWVPADQQQMVLAHELTHALQDQSFDLWNFMHASRDDDDASAARQALVEGYATLAMIQAMLGSVPIEKVPSLDAMMDQVVNQQMTEYPVFSKAPFFLRFQVLFPYAQGMHFVREGLTDGGWKRLNETFERPPSTTRDIFQPDHYFKHPDNSDHAPATLDLPAPPAIEHEPGVKQVDANFMGELGYYSLLGQMLSQDEAAKIAKSWTGDRYLVYEGPAAGQFTLIARTRWETAAAANAFCTDYRSILEKRWPDTAQDSKRSAAPEPAGAAASALAAEGDTSPAIMFSTHGPRRTVLLLEGNECRWAEGVPALDAHGLTRWLQALH